MFVQTYISDNYVQLKQEKSQGQTEKEIEKIKLAIDYRELKWEECRTIA